MRAAGPTADLIKPAMLRETYRVEARVERCSQGRAVLIVDSTAAAQRQS